MNPHSAQEPAGFAGIDAGTQADAVGQTRALLSALEGKDLPTIADLLDRQATLTLPLSFSGAPEPAVHFTGKDQVLGYLTGVFTTMGSIHFTDLRLSVTADGGTTFVQAKGDFTTADGRPYHNVYIFRYNWNDGHLVSIEEYGNPVTFTATFGQLNG